MPVRTLTVVSVLALAACSAEQPASQEPASPTEAESEPPAPSQPAPDPASPPRPVEASATQCRPGERALYNCPYDDGRVVSICAGEQIAYRFGPLGDPELEISRTPGQDGVWQGGVVGQGGGQQTHLRFQADGYDYVVFSGYDGRLADNPGRTYSGVSVLRDGDEVRRLTCPVTSYQTEIASSMIPQDIPAEAAGSDFDGWF